ncbi:RNA polymerase sigma factor [Microbacterium sp. A93]|uniref:RNA polymerase sigma factor n=1 Tax=Microbacterium sp. A93 TaxID=3450716 RepID=UPI003F42D652
MYIEDADAELIRLARRGDRGAFATLFERHSKAVYLYSWSMLRDDSDADDITQDVFVVAWRLPWMLVTARNLSRNQLRRRRSALSLDETLLPVDATRQERVEEVSWVRQAVLGARAYGPRECAVARRS